MKRMLLPLSHDDRMPPSDKPQATAAENRGHPRLDRPGSAPRSDRRCAGAAEGLARRRREDACRRRQIRGGSGDGSHRHEAAARGNQARRDRAGAPLGLRDLLGRRKPRQRKSGSLAHRHRAARGCLRSAPRPPSLASPRQIITSAHPAPRADRSTPARRAGQTQPQCCQRCTTPRPARGGEQSCRRARRGIPRNNPSNRRAATRGAESKPGCPPAPARPPPCKGRRGHAISHARRGAESRPARTRSLARFEHGGAGVEGAEVAEEGGGPSRFEGAARRELDSGAGPSPCRAQDGAKKRSSASRALARPSPWVIPLASLTEKRNPAGTVLGPARERPRLVHPVEGGVDLHGRISARVAFEGAALLAKTFQREPGAKPGLGS